MSRVPSKRASSPVVLAICDIDAKYRATAAGRILRAAARKIISTGEMVLSPIDKRYDLDCAQAVRDRTLKSIESDSVFARETAILWRSIADHMFNPGYGFWKSPTAENLQAVTAGMATLNAIALKMRDYIAASLTQGAPDETTLSITVKFPTRLTKGSIEIHNSDGCLFGARPFDSKQSRAHHELRSAFERLDLPHAYQVSHRHLFDNVEIKPLEITHRDIGASSDIFETMRTMGRPDFAGLSFDLGFGRATALAA